jgi:hypothetical protein
MQARLSRPLSGDCFRILSYDIGQPDHGRSNLSDSDICMVSVELWFICRPFRSV